LGIFVLFVVNNITLFKRILYSSFGFGFVNWQIHEQILNKF